MREITRKNSIKNREKFIVDRCKGKKVLHLGCCDSPYTEFKFKKGIALFQRIEKICSKQKGLDIDTDQISYLKTLGYKNIDYYDLNQSKTIDFSPDVIVFADTLEHLMNLETVISSLKKLMNNKTELIITVPNATMFSRFIGNFIGKIKEHEDHKVSFTYSSLKQLLIFNQLTVNKILFAGELNIDNSFRNEQLPIKILRAIYNTVYQAVRFFFPLFSESLIITCSFEQNKQGEK